LDVALGATDRPKGAAVGKLAQLYAPHFDKAFERKLRASFASAEERFSDGAWGVAIRLFSSDGQWIKPLIRRHWPRASDLKAAILRHEQPEQDQWLANQLLELRLQANRYLLARLSHF
jgi:hypothetical protein